jgi:hypothetical protein
MRKLYNGQTLPPDLVIGIVAPMGANKEIVQQSLATALKHHGYKGRKVQLTDWLNCQLPAEKKLSRKPRTHEWYRKAQKMGNWYCANTTSKTQWPGSPSTRSEYCVNARTKYEPPSACRTRS